MGISTDRSMVKDQVDALARERKRVLELAQALGNVSDACRRAGVDRATFYEWRKRYRECGIDGLKDQSRAHHSHSMMTSVGVEERILALSFDHPAWGCGRISSQLRLDGVPVSAPTVQGILTRHGLGSKCERLMKLVERSADESAPLSAEQARLLEKAYS